jgi:hypothetical protein
MRHHLTVRAEAHSTTTKPAIDTARDAITAALAKVPGLVNLTAGERARAFRTHVGADAYVRQIAALGKEKPTLVPANVDPSKMTAQLDAAEQLAPLRAVLEHALQTIDDAILLDEGEAYRAALDILAVARGHARGDGTIAAAIAPFEGFLATGPHAKKDEAPAGTAK